MLNIRDKKYYDGLNNLVETTLKSVLNEYEFKKHELNLLQSKKEWYP